jgi:pyrroloquinoline quinone biosynthesis protein D
MNNVPSTARPRLIRNCRLGDSAGQSGGQEDILLMPEGVIRLKGTGGDIIRLCDGARTLTEIFTALKEKYPSADPAQIEAEALSFLNTLREKRVLDF